MTGYAAINATGLRFGSDLLVRSNKPVSISIEFTKGRFEAVGECKESARVQLSVDHPQHVLLDGKPAVIVMDAMGKYMTLRIPVGRHIINGDIGKKAQ